ncbi:MAG: NADH-quinone oxidoreductase subunit L [Candidatus Nitrosocaldaceae archaeon]
MIPIEFIFRMVEGGGEFIHNSAFDALAINVWLIWILPMIGAMISPLLNKVSKRGRDISPAIFAFVSATLSSTLIPVMLEGDEIHTQISWINSIGIKAGLLADTLSIIISNLVAWISFLIIVYSIGYMKGDRDLARYWFFMLFFIGSMQLIVLSDNFLMLFFGWEGVGLASYALIGFWYRDRSKDYVGRIDHYALAIPQFTSPTHAGMKAFLMTKAGDIFMITGIFLIFMHTGTFEYKPLIEDHTWAENMHTAGLLIPAAVLIFGGAIGKSAQFPLHEWLLEAMTGPTAVSALIHAATMVKAGVYLVARIGPIFFIAADIASAQFFEVVAWVGAITAFMLASQAIVNKEIKKVLAYSTGSQIGYMMLALGIAGLSTSFVEGYSAGIFHLASHAMFKASLFMIAGGLLHVAESRFMDDMGGLKKNMKKSYIAIMAAGLSLAGAPIITSGFWSKDAIFAALLESSYVFAPVLYVMAVLTAVMTSFYTMRMIGMAMFGKKSKHIEELEEHSHHIHEVSALMFIPFSILAAGTIIVGISGPFVEGFIHERLGIFLTNSYGIEVEHEEIKLNWIAVISSLVSFGIGAGLGYIYYIKRAANPEVISKNAFTRGVYKFLENRWYVNSIYYWLFVIGPLFIARIFWKYFENVVVDGINPALEFSMAWWSKIVRYIQSGVVQTYVYAFGIGIIFILIILLSV